MKVDNIIKPLKRLSGHWKVTSRPAGLGSIPCSQSPVPPRIGAAPPPRHTPGGKEEDGRRHGRKSTGRHVVYCKIMVMLQISFDYNMTRMAQHDFLSNINSKLLNGMKMGNLSQTIFNREHPLLGVSKILNFGFFKMQPKIVVMLVLGTPEHLEFSLILQNWPFAMHFNFWVRAQRKRLKTVQKVRFSNLAYFC